MKKVYTLTFHHVLNFGAILQAYALVKFLNGKGYDAKIINYIPFIFLYQVYRPAKGFRNLLDKIKKVYFFHRFRSRYIPMSRRIIFKKNIQKIINAANAVLIGSDQVWNYKLTGGQFNSLFFAEGLPDNAKKIAYAASAGSVRIKYHQQRLTPLLTQFDKIGVRETILADDVNYILQTNHAEVVLDPSLLLSMHTYKQIACFDKIPKENYLLSYVVGSGSMLQKFEHYINHVKNKTSLPVMHIGSKKINNADMSMVAITPEDWLAFFYRADFVVTNSFHGVAFCIKFRKKFICVPQIQENLNERQLTLMKSLNLYHRYIPDISQLTESIFDDIDYDMVHDHLDILIKKSEKFILDAIDG